MSLAQKEFLSRTPKSREMYEAAAEVLAMEVVGTIDMPYPVYLKEGHGSRVTDVDGNEYIDLTMGFGPHILGHAPKVVTDAVHQSIDHGFQFGIHTPYQEPLARMIVDGAPCAEKVVFCNSGTEATMYGIRAARAFTGKSKIAIFEGGYHGAHDYVLALSGRGGTPARPVTSARGAGIPGPTTEQVVMLPWDTPDALEIIRELKDELAVVLTEPVQGINPRLDSGVFLKELRKVTQECGVLLLFDEVVTGFRLAYGGGQELFEVTPDLATYGKTLGGGMPIGAVAGRDDIMRVFTRDRASGDDLPRIFAGGTFSGNPVTMSAGLAMVTYLHDHPELYRYLAEQGTRLANEINDFCHEEEMPAQVLSAFSLFHVRFQNSPIKSSRDFDNSWREAEREFYVRLMLHGVLVPGVHSAIISTAHTPEDIDTIVGAVKASMLELREEGIF